MIPVSTILSNLPEIELPLRGESPTPEIYLRHALAAIATVREEQIIFQANMVLMIHPDGPRTGMAYSGVPVPDHATDQEKALHVLNQLMQPGCHMEVSERGILIEYVIAVIMVVAGIKFKMPMEKVQYLFQTYTYKKLAS